MDILTVISNWALENGPIGILCFVMLYLYLRGEKRNNVLTDKLVILIENNTSAFTKLETLVRERMK